MNEPRYTIKELEDKCTEKKIEQLMCDLGIPPYLRPRLMESLSPHFDKQ